MVTVRNVSVRKGKVKYSVSTIDKKPFLKRSVVRRISRKKLPLRKGRKINLRGRSTIESFKSGLFDDYKNSFEEVVDGNYW